MAERIGKYQVLERIGRGGMGTIFKAHDPILDRPVALKVISNEVEVTDELRTRFFREAQACARLSHPNIVTVFDMGEEEGRLFIVMEMLDGEELRQLVAQRKALPLEDKLTIMMQVCDGLHYAHQKGIVHRDIKPGNIMVLRNGQVKILDFGIALIATAEMELTRTGLIMGTLRYLSPEQVRGRADHRSDIFSVGAVFYELLTFRPPFDGADPIQILDQLRSEDPPSLRELDPSLPPELVAIVERAMRKDPAERFPDLEQMRSQLEQVQRGLTEEAQRIRARLREQFEQVRKLEAALAERIGSFRDDATEPVLDDRGGRLATLRALESELVGRLKAAQAKIARAEALAPALQRGLTLLQSGQFAMAVAEFEAIVEEMPEHVQALEGLSQARKQADAQRHRKLAAKLMQEAHTALVEGRHAICLELVQQVAALPPPSEVIPEIASLRQAAEAALAAQEAAQRAQQQAEGARDQMVQVRLTAQAQAAAQYAPDLWNDAEGKFSNAQAALARQAHGEAGPAFAAAAVAYQRSEAAAREAQHRELEAAEQAREQMAQGQQRAQAAGAAKYARKLSDVADAKSAEAQEAFGKRALVRAAGLFNEAVALYRRAEEAASEARQRELRLAEAARDRMAQGQRAAAALDAGRHAPALWEEAAAKAAGAEVDLAQEHYAKAAETFDEALVLYRQAANQVKKTLDQQRDQAEEGRAAIAECRSSASAAGAPVHAPSEWSEAEVIVASSDAAFVREAYAEASRGFDRGMALYRLAEERARDAAHVIETARLNAVKAAEAAAMARQAAVDAQASKYAAKEWQAGESTEAEASAAASRQEHAAARSLFAESRRLFAAAAQAAAVAMEAESRRVDTMMSDSRRLLESGNVSACLRQLSEVLTLKPGHAAAEALRREAEERRRQSEAAKDSTEPQVVTVFGGQPADALEQTIPQGEIAAGFPPVLAEVSTVLLDAPTIRAEPRLVPSNAPPILAAAATTIPPDTLATSTAGMARARTGGVSPPGMGSQWRHWRLATAAVGGLAALGLGVLLWLPRSAPPVSPPAPQVTAAPPLSSPVQQGIPAPQSIPAPVVPGAGPTAPRDAAGSPDTAALHKREVEEAGQARAVVAKARQDAERVAAPSRAPRTFSLAQQKENEAEAALERQDAASAKLEFQKAQRTYKEAAQEAERAATGEEKQRVAALQRQQSDAEQARAAQETKRASEAQQQVAMLTANVEQWRGRVLARREEAVRTEANRLAKDVFDAAQAKQTEAEGLIGRQNYTAASLAYQDAAERYMEATQRAQGVREAKAQAESARTRMLAEKQQADPAASDFASGLAEEKQGNGLYERLAFREATEKFKSAETFFVRAGVKPAPTSPAPPKPDPVRPAPKRPPPPF